MKSGDRTAPWLPASRSLAAWVRGLWWSASSTYPGGATPAIFCIDSATLFCFTMTSTGARRIWTARGHGAVLMLLIVASPVAPAIDFKVTLDTFSG